MTKYTEQEEHDLTWMFDFGKYKYQTIRAVLSKDPDYIQWCRENIDDFEVNDEIIEMLESEEIRELHFGD